MLIRENAEEMYGVIFTDAMMAEAVKRFGDNYYNTDYPAFAEEIELDELVSYSGQVIYIGKDGCRDWNKEDMFFHDKLLYFAHLRKTGTIFAPAYTSMYEVAAELKENYGKYLPDDFDYANNLTCLIGVYYG